MRSNKRKGEHRGGGQERAGREGERRGGRGKRRREEKRRGESRLEERIGAGELSEWRGEESMRGEGEGVKMERTWGE